MARISGRKLEHAQFHRIALPHRAYGRAASREDLRALGPARDGAGTLRGSGVGRCPCDILAMLDSSFD